MNRHKAHASPLMVVDWLVMLRSCCFAIILFNRLFCGVAMVTKERRIGAEIITFDAGSLNSQVARVVARLGVLGYRLGSVLAILSVLLASAFAALTPEPLVFRMLSVLVLGVFPGLAAWTIGWMLLWILRAASIGCDLVVGLVQPKCQILVETTWFISDPLVRFAKGGVAQMIRATEAFPATSRHCLERLIATTMFYSDRTVRGFVVAYRYLFMAVTSPVRLAARILMAIIPQQISVVKSRGAQSRRIRGHTFTQAQFSASHRHR